MPKEHYSVAIDGPAGAGKSTLAREAAGQLGILYVDTGAIYRTIGYAALLRSVDPHSEAEVAALLPTLSVELRHEADGAQHMLLDGEDVSREIRLPEVSRYASAVSAMPFVRAYLLEMQRTLARQQSVIMDGRDIGTVVLPEAEVKIYLTASPEERARRRYEELCARGTECDYAQVLREVNERDYSDTHRSAAPLQAAADAVTIDTTGLTFEESRERILSTIRERLA